MGYIEDLDSLLNKIKTNHFDTIHKLSEMYKKTESLIDEMKQKGEDGLEDGMEKLREMLKQSTGVRDEQVNEMREHIKTLVSTIFESSSTTQNAFKGFSNTFSSEGTSDDSIFEKLPFFNLEEEDQQKLVDIAANSSQAMLDIFQRVGEIFVENTQNKDETKNASEENLRAEERFGAMNKDNEKTEKEKADKKKSSNKSNKNENKKG